jgi:hypothetical protein
MAIGTSILLLAVGAILRFAVYYHVHGASIGAIGIILMIAGALGLILGFTVLGPVSYRARQDGGYRTRRTDTVSDGVNSRTVVREQTERTDVLP